MRVKICGITRNEDARLAVGLGAWALGFIQWPGSPRYIEPDAIARVVSGLPASVLKVGVFRDQAAEDVCRAAHIAGMDAIQLHGAEEATAYAGCGFVVIKAVAVGDRTVPDEVWRIPPDVTVLLDAHDPVRGGGTGRTIDWNVAATVSARRRVILSGGLKPDNVRGALRAVTPWAIDVSSGVERSPGVKDAGLLRALFDAVVSSDVRRGTTMQEGNQR